MPRMRVVFFRDDDGRAPALDWLESLPTQALDK